MSLRALIQHHHAGIEHMIPLELMAAKVKEAVAARRNPDFLIVARTNAIRASSMDDALRRGDAYRKAGADLDDNYNLQIMMRGRLDRPVTEQEREQARDPFAAWGGYLEPTSDPQTRYYTKANIHNDYLVDHRLAKSELMIEQARLRLLRLGPRRADPRPPPAAAGRGGGLVSLRAVHQVQERRAVQVPPQVLDEEGAAVVVVARDKARDVR